MQISDEHVVVVVVVVRRVVVVVVRRMVVVVVVVGGADSELAVVVVVVVVGPELADDEDDSPVVDVVVGLADRDAGGIGSTAARSAGSSWRPTGSSVSTPAANSAHVMAPRTAPTASRP
jgi:hypothetical protein